MAIDNSLLGEAIRIVRTARGLSQRELAGRSGMTVTFLSLLENGHRGASVDTLNILERELDVPAACLLTLASKPVLKDECFGELLNASKKAILAAIEASSAAKK